MKSDMQVSVAGKPAIPYSVFVGQLFKSGIDISNDMTPLRAELVHAVMGISGEAGELLDAIKKYCIYNKELDRKNVIEELGDLRFYMVALQNLLNISDSEVIMANVGKLGKRYAKGYSDKQAQDRADKILDSIPELPEGE
jgi:NTP pyrophosphatase (non-canonical NTP hydrolase)